MAEKRHPLEQVLGHRFADPDILSQALTHRGSLGTYRKDGAAPGAADAKFLLVFLRGGYDAASPAPVAGAQWCVMPSITSRRQRTPAYPSGAWPCM